MAEPYRLRAGDQGPRQCSSVTCGSASLVVARMLRDPRYAAGLLGDPPSAAGRFAAAERQVHRRTNAVVGPGRRLQLPWPQALGTPPWGARHELESGAGVTGTRYRTRWVRWSRAALADAYAALHSTVAPERPGVLFVGSSWLPRHVVLVIGSAVEVDGTPGSAPLASLTVYEPSSGRVISLTADDLQRHTEVAGWRRCWVALIPGPTVAGQAPRRSAPSDAA